MRSQKKNKSRKVGCDESHQFYIDIIQVVRSIGPCILFSFLCRSSITGAQQLKFLSGRQIGTVRTKVIEEALWIRSEGEPLWHAFRATQISLNLIPERQGVGICFDAAGRGYDTIGEMKHLPAYYFPAFND